MIWNNLFRVAEFGSLFGNQLEKVTDCHRFEHSASIANPIAIMNSVRFARAALRARSTAIRVPVQRRTYAEAVPDKVSSLGRRLVLFASDPKRSRANASQQIKLSLVFPHQVREFDSSRPN